MGRFYGDADIAPMLAEFGVPMTYGQTTVSAIRDEADAEDIQAAGGAFVGRLVTVEYKTTALPALAAGAIVEVDGDFYTVVQVMRVGDGATSRALLSPNLEA